MSNKYQRGGKTILGIIGGDSREKIAINILAEKGLKVNVFKKGKTDSKNVTYYDKLQKLTLNSRFIIAPMSGTDEKGRLKSTFVDGEVILNHNFFKLLNKNHVFIIGTALPEIKKILQNKKIELIELAKMDDIAILNAVPTAEAALKIAIDKTDITLFKSNILTFGLGKVGLTLSRRLKALGANSYAVTRNNAAYARGIELGLEMIRYNELNKLLPKIDIIFNTVPARIIDKKEIDKLQNNAVIIDLASAPGGTNFAYAKTAGIKALLALGLPGKTAPETAGKIFADKIYDIVCENC